MKRIKSFLNSWYLSIPIFISFVIYAIFYSISEFDALNSIFSVNPLIMHVIDFWSLIFLIILMSLLHFKTNLKKIFQKQFILIFLFSLFYAGLEIWRYLYKSFSFEQSNFFNNHLIIFISFDKLSIWTSANFMNKLVALFDSLLSVILTIGLLFVLVRRNAHHLIDVNMSVYQTFSSYLKRISKYIKNIILKILLKIKSILFNISSKLNFVYIIKFIKIIKCSLIKGFKHHSLNFSI